MGRSTKANEAQSALWAEINRQMTKIRVRRILRAVRLSDSTNERQEIISLIGWYFCWCWHEQWLSLMLAHETRLYKVQLVSAICGSIRVGRGRLYQWQLIFARCSKPCASPRGGGGEKVGTRTQDYSNNKVCSAGKSCAPRDVTQGNPLRPSVWGFNPRTPGGFGRTPTPGGLISAPPLRSRKLRGLEKNGKRRLVEWEKQYKKHSDNFSLKSKLRSPEVIKGKVFPNFRITWHGFILCALSRSL